MKPRTRAPIRQANAQIRENKGGGHRTTKLYALSGEDMFQIVPAAKCVFSAFSSHSPVSAYGFSYAGNILATHLKNDAKRTPDGST